ncbi:hypothetical protein GS415_02230 [Rhodococcus hoagii]|nr:hypothetical protein [Prescottella equi]
MTDPISPPVNFPQATGNEHDHGRCPRGHQGVDGGERHHLRRRRGLPDGRGQTHGLRERVFATDAQVVGERRRHPDAAGGDARDQQQRITRTTPRRGPAHRVTGTRGAVDCRRRRLQFHADPLDEDFSVDSS